MLKPTLSCALSHLKEKLDSLDGSHGCLGDGGGDASGHEVLGEGNGCLIHGCFRVFLLKLQENNRYLLIYQPPPLLALRPGLRSLVSGCSDTHSDEMADVEAAEGFYQIDWEREGGRAVPRRYRDKGRESRRIGTYSCHWRGSRASAST